MACSEVALCLTVLLACGVSGHAYSYEVRGLDPSNKARYHPGKDFTCLDGSDIIAFSMVNDDYCDCEDGSDEPGTAACPTGGFYCHNAGHQPSTVLSSRVNDGICDCCDGGDEWWGEVQCENVCAELGKKKEIEQRQHREMQAEGYQKRVQYEQQGIRSREDKASRLEELKVEQVRLEEEVEALKQEKETVEEPERVAKEEHEKRWEEEQEVRKAAERKAEARTAFEQLDTDSNGAISVSEIQQRMELDDDGDGEVSLEEALAYLDNEESVDFPVFTDRVWSFVSDKVTFAPPATEHVETTPPPAEAPPTPDTGDEDYDDDDYDYDDEEDSDEAQDGKSSDDMPPYPEETQALIAAADAAREALKLRETEKRDVDREVGDLNKFLGTELGEAMQFATLYDQCYEYTDREYTYKMCSFNKVTQRSKSGGRETSLGNWMTWSGPEGDLYSEMLFENGEGCWNGPKRSMKVSVSCGLEEAIHSASEPNRCEYVMEFTTPAACKHPTLSPTAATPGHHQEL